MSRRLSRASQERRIASFDKALALVAARDTKHGSAPPPDEPKLLRRDELPAWCKPLNTPHRCESYFYTRHPIGQVPRVVQVIFAFGEFGASFQDRAVHTQGAIGMMRPGERTEIPGCVLIAVGVEQIRRSRRPV